MRTERIEIEARVELVAKAVCPICSKALHKRVIVPELVVRAATADLVVSALDALRSEIAATMAARGWTSVCGACRDHDVGGATP